MKYPALRRSTLNCLSLLALFALAASAAADDTASATLEKRSDASALKMSIVNSIVNYVGNAAHASIDNVSRTKPRATASIVDTITMATTAMSAHEMFSACIDSTLSWRDLARPFFACPDQRNQFAHVPDFPQLQPARWRFHTRRDHRGRKSQLRRFF